MPTIDQLTHDFSGLLELPTSRSTNDRYTKFRRTQTLL